MAFTYSYLSGDAITADQIQLNIGMPDANGGNVAINGSVQAIGGAVIAVNTTVALPVAPASGLIYFIIECNKTTGACDLQQSTSAFPIANTGCDIIFQDILSPGTTDPAVDPNNQDL